MSRPIVTVFTLAAAVSAGGQLFAPNAKDLLDRTGFTWRSEDSAHLRFYVEPNSFADHHLDALEQSGEKSRDGVLALLGEQRYDDRVTVFALESRARMKALIGKETNGQALPGRKIVLYVVSDDVNASGAHELCHVLARGLWGNSEEWINEGLAVYADDPLPS